MYTLPLKKVPGTQTFIVSDRNERRVIKEAMTTFAQEIKTLKATKKQKADQVDASLEVLQYTHRFQNCLQVSDYIFSKARQPSGHIQLQDVENLWPFVNTALRLYWELGLKISPKAHTIEDHLCEQLLLFKGVGDLGEDFVKQSHQGGIKKEARSRNARNHDEAAILHCK